MPRRLPIQCTSAPISRRRAATARPGLVCPPVPPPAMTTRNMLARGDALGLTYGSEALSNAGAQKWPPHSPNRRTTLRGFSVAPASPALEGEVDEARDQL